jgi:hypothetical protein
MNTRIAQSAWAIDNTPVINGSDWRGVYLTAYSCAVTTRTNRYDIQFVRKNLVLALWSCAARARV